MSRNPATCVVSLTQCSGVDLNVHLVLDEKPTRQDQKLKTLTKYIQHYPSGWKKRLELAELLYAMGRWEQSVEQYRQVLKQQPRLIDVWLKLGKIRQLMGKEAEAIEVYESALPQARSQATRYHVEGLIEICRRCPQQAAQGFERAASLEPDNAAHWLALGQTHMGIDSPVAALQAFDTLLSRNPDDVVALIHSYDALLVSGHFQEAKRRISLALELDPDNFRALKRLTNHRCTMRLVSGEAGQQTRQMIRALQRLAPDAVDAHELLAYYHLCRGEWAKGVAVLQEFTEQHQNNPTGWYYYSRCLFYTGDYQAAAEAMLKAYGLYANDCEIYRALCEILPAAGRLDELQPLIEEMLRFFPERWSVWTTAGRVLVEHFHNIEQGCALTEMAHQLQPQLANAWFCHGRVLVLAGKHREAVETLEQGWEWLEEGWISLSVPAAVWLGENYRVLGDDAASRKWWEKASERTQELIEFDPATARYWQGRALKGLGDGVGAIEAYRSALNQQLFYPVHGEVKEALKRLPTMVRKGCRA